MSNMLDNALIELVKELTELIRDFRKELAKR